MGENTEKAPLAGAVILTIVAIACTQIPLVNTLGYESSAIIAVVSSFIAGFLVIRSVRGMLHREGEAGWNSGRILRLFFRRLGVATLLLVTPLFIISANGWFVKNCSFAEGFAYYLLLPVVSVWWAAALGLFCAVHYRFSRLAFTGAFLLTIAYAVWRGYASPAIFSYNLFYGYFPGFSYDEAMGISLPLVLFRLVTIACGGVCIWMALLIVKKSRATDGTVAKGITLLRTLGSAEWRIVAGAGAISFLLLFFFRCELGWESTAGYIAGRLGGETRTEHFVIHYPAGEMTDGEARRIAGEHEFRLAQLMRDFGVTGHETITSFIYPGAATKRQLIGTATTNIARPWTNEIHLTVQTVETTLKHELAHVVAGTFGLPVIRASLSPGLVEGLATAQEWIWGTRTLHQHARAMQEIGALPDLRRVMTPVGFAVSSTGASYVSAGSFCRYLIDAYGMKPLLAVYGGTSFDAAFGVPLDGLIREWERFLGRLGVGEGDREAAQYFFRRPTIFAKTCARVAAGWNEDAAAAMMRGDYNGARELYLRIFEETGSSESFGGLLTATFRAGDYAGVHRLCDRMILRSDLPARYTPLLLMCGDARWALGDPGEARELYRSVRTADLSEALTEGAAVRLAVLADTAGRNSWLRYFLAEPSDTVRLRLLDSLTVPGDSSSGLARYLRGRIFARAGKPAAALETLEPLNLTRISRTLEGIRQTTVARQWYLLGKYDAARPAFWMSMNVVTTEAGVIQAREWTSRADWMRAHKY